MPILPRARSRASRRGEGGWAPLAPSGARGIFGRTEPTGKNAATTSGLSPGKTPAGEKRLLLRRAGTAQHRVAVGKAPEAADDVGVLLGVLCELIVAIAARQLHAAVLVGQMFRVHQ